MIDGELMVDRIKQLDRVNQRLVLLEQEFEDLQKVKLELLRRKLELSELIDGKVKVKLFEKHSTQERWDI